MIKSNYNEILSECKCRSLSGWHRRGQLIAGMALSVSIISGVVALDIHHKSKTNFQQLSMSSSVQVMGGVNDVFADNYYPENLAAVVDDRSADMSDSSKSITVKVKKHDTLAKVFNRAGLNSKDAAKIVALGKTTHILRNLKLNNQFDFEVDAQKRLLKFTYGINDTDSLLVTKHDQHFHAKTLHIEPMHRLTFASTVIHHSLTSSGKKAGISHSMLKQFASIFRSKINFARTVRVGDRIALYYDSLYVKDKKISDGKIAIAEYVHKGKAYRAIGFTDPYGTYSYYTPKGESYNAPFMRFPVQFKTISSKFSLRRWHPILHKFCPHWGVDFAARIGTPVKASSDGRISFMGWQNHAGNTVVIKHANYETLYAHLSHFPKNIHRGMNVSQGQVIGFVGSTGLSTGSHLHYEFHVNGVRFDPLKVKLPATEMIASNLRSKFNYRSRIMVARLEMHEKSMLAMK